MDFEKPEDKKVVPITRGHEIRKEKKQKEVLAKKEQEIDINEIEEITRELKQEDDKNKRLLEEARVWLHVLSEHIDNMEAVGLGEEKEKLRALQLKLYTEISLYEEFYPYL